MPSEAVSTTTANLAGFFIGFDYQNSKSLGEPRDLVFSMARDVKMLVRDNVAGNKEESRIAIALGRVVLDAREVSRDTLVHWVKCFYRPSAGEVDLKVRLCGSRCLVEHLLLNVS